MPRPYDVLALGNAIVDVIASHPPSFLEQRGIEKGSMRLIDAGEADRLYRELGPGREVSGGSAANTAVGVAALGGRAAFTGRVAADQLGEVFRHDIRAAGVAFDTPAAAGGVPTGRCLIVVTPDGQRTMNTYLGACREVSAADIDEARVRDSSLLYIEGYLWDLPAAIEAARKAAEIMRAAGGKIALTLSEVFCVQGHRAEFAQLMQSGFVDLVFANENEAKAMLETEDFNEAVAGLAGLVPLAVVTRSEKGAVVVTGGERIAVPAARPARVLDSTGAGDLFAAGFLTGYGRGRGMGDCARMGAIAAAEVIEHYGARPESDLMARMGALLG